MPETPSVNSRVSIPWRTIAFSFTAFCLGVIAGAIGYAVAGGNILNYLSLRTSQGGAGEVIRGNTDATKAIDNALDILRRAQSGSSK